MFYKQHNKVANFWFWSSIFFSLGALIIASRTGLPLFLGYVISNFLVFYSHYLCFRGIEYSNNGESPRHYFVEILGLSYAIGFIVIKLQNQPDFMPIYVGIFTSGFHLWIFLKLFRKKDEALNRFSNFIALCYLGSSFVWLARIYLSGIYNFGESTDPGFANWFTLLLLVLILVLKDFLFLALLLTKSTQELLNVNQLLEEKEQLVKELSEEKMKSESANVAKGHFLANVSHEIRTPLHGLIGLTSMILKSSMSEEIRKSLDKVLYSSKALLVILNDILDFSKIEAGVIEIHNEPFKMKHLVDDVHDLFSIPATEKGLELRFDIDPATPEVMIGDFYKLRQVLFNLVGNSIKFTQQGFVEVKVGVDQREADSLGLTMMVKDTGIGISEKDLKVIFEPFNQLDNTNSRRYDGVGLGLPITQNILLKMGSELVMKSQPGVGTESTFAIRLEINDRIPYKHRTLKAPSLEEGSNMPYASLVGRHVLVAEDNPINIEVVRQYLSFLKIESHFVTDGLQCLEALKNNRYDWVLMDIQMPNLDGVQATYQIRLIQEMKDLPIIGLSAGVAESDREKGLQSGMNDFLVKPFEVDELAKTLMKCLHP